MNPDPGKRKDAAKAAKTKSKAAPAPAQPARSPRPAPARLPRGKPIVAALRELKRTVATIALFHAVVDGLVVFLLFYLVFILIQLEWYWAFSPFGLYMLWHVPRLMRRARLQQIESRLPFLREQLITSADYLDKENEVVRELHADVLKKMRDIYNSVFIGFGTLSTRLVATIILSFLIIFASAQDVHFLDIRETAKQVKRAFEPIPKYAVEESLLEFEESELEEALGEAKLAELGYQELQLELNPSESEIDLSKIKPPEQRRFRTRAATQIEAEGQSAFEENIPKSYQKIVQNYFREIAKSD